MTVAVTPEHIVKAAASVFEPMCEETAKILRPVKMMPNDRLEVVYNANTNAFDVQAFAVGSIFQGGRGAASKMAAQDWVLNVPERKNLGSGYGRWELKATDFTALVLAANWPMEHVHFDKNARTVFEYLIYRFGHQFVASQKRALFKLAGVVPAMPPEFSQPADPNCELSKYQMTAVGTTVWQEAAALNMEQGTGKTPCLISRICTEAKRKTELYEALIVVPKNVRENWRNEFVKFATVPGRVAILRGGLHDRMNTIVEAYSGDMTGLEFVAIICSYESLVSTWEILRMRQWDLAGLDEAHLIKSPTTARAKAAMRLRDSAKQRTCLTGTPTANSICDLYSQLEFLGEGLSGFSSMAAFAAYYMKFVSRENAEGKVELVPVGIRNLPILHERLARLSFFISKAEALPDLPEKQYRVIEVEMTEEQATAYAVLQSQLALEIEAALASDLPKQMTVSNVLTKLLRLSQITSGFYRWNAAFDDDGNQVRAAAIESVKDNPKLEALVELLKERGPKSKTIVWACFRHDIYTICERLRQEGIPCVSFFGGTSDADRAAAEKAFNGDPNMKVFVGNPAAGGVGLNLHGFEVAKAGTPEDHGCNCDCVVYFSQDWSLTKRSQSEDRAHRRGTRVPVEYVDLVVPASIDEQIRMRVLGKKMVSMEISDLRAIMGAVLKSLPSTNGERS